MIKMVDYKSKYLKYKYKYFNFKLKYGGMEDDLLGDLGDLPELDWNLSTQNNSELDIMYEELKKLQRERNSFIKLERTRSEMWETDEEIDLGINYPDDDKEEELSDEIKEQYNKNPEQFITDKKKEIKKILEDMRSKLTNY
tara:strand:- start:894 stop:1316 length:423 start_codon:yes stop_codon:yes gene_type:complete